MPKKRTDRARYRRRNNSAAFREAADLFEECWGRRPSAPSLHSRWIEYAALVDQARVVAKAEDFRRQRILHAVEVNSSNGRLTIPTWALAERFGMTKHEMNAYLTGMRDRTA